MNKYYIYLLIFLPVLFIISIVLDSKTDLKENIDVNENRIEKIVEDISLNIYKIDDHEYAVSINGGIIHLESCQCKKDTL